MAKHLNAESCAALLEKISEVHSSTSVYVFFYGKRDNNKSWCPDCVKADPVVLELAKQLPDTAAFIECDVGNRPQWKDSQSEFRVRQEFKLTAIPTLQKWNTPERLIEEQCWEKETVKTFFGL